MVGYQIGRFTPYIRGEYIGSEVGAYMFNPFYVPEHNPIGGFAVPMDLQEGVVGTRIDLSTWCSVKLEYQVTAGIGNRRWDLATPVIHSGLANWSFGL